MKRLKNIFLIFILYCIVGCSCDDCGYLEPEKKIHAHANKSEIMVKIVAIDYDIYEKFIAHGDTLHSSFYKKKYYDDEWMDIPEWHFDFIAPYCDNEKNICNPIRIELHFLDDPQKCLIFDGPIEHDGFDIRSWDSYERGKEIPDWAGIEYVYTITPEHRAMAKEEYCPQGKRILIFYNRG
jgi:hypothetical protein